jgi:hypothetical protein
MLREEDSDYDDNDDDRDDEYYNDRRYPKTAFQVN